MNNEGLDQLDKDIIAALQENARMSFTEIAEMVGVSRVAVKNRVAALEEQKIIQGYKVIVDSLQNSVGVSFIMDIETIPEVYESVVSVLAKDRYIHKIYSTTGECRIHCIGLAPNNHTMDAHVNYIYRNTKGIRKMSCHTLLRVLKDTDGGVEFNGFEEFEHMENCGEDKGQ